MIVFSVATYRRPDGLRRLLESIAEQDLAAAGVAEADVAIVVADNDRAESGRDAAATMKRFRTEYVTEPIRSIAGARNAGIRAALALGAETIAFLDDDETIPSGWLAAMLGTMRDHSAPIVFGRVAPHFVSPPPRWMLDGRFFERREIFPTGALLRPENADTGNLLVRREVFDALGEFDPRRKLQGAEDAEFLSRAAGAGFSIVSCAEGISFHTIPATRASRAWLLQRSFRWGNQSTALELGTRGGVRRRGKLLLTGTAAAFRAGRNSLLLTFRGRAYEDIFRELRLVTKGLGTVAAALGIRYDEYRFFPASESPRTKSAPTFRRGTAACARTPGPLGAPK